MQQIQKSNLTEVLFKLGVPKKVYLETLKKFDFSEKELWNGTFEKHKFSPALSFQKAKQFEKLIES